MKKYTKEELDEIFKLHKLWLDNKEGGQIANLSSANLSYANLSSADLSSANLSYANLSSANLSSANLSYANLSSANLSYANLSSANLRSADLRSANLSSANLSYANLSSANLISSFNLNFAFLRYAIFCETLLKYSETKTYSPINITSLKYFVTIFKDEIYWGCRTFKNVDEVKSFTIDMCSEEWDEEQFNMDKEIIINTDTLYQKYWAK